MIYVLRNNTFFCCAMTYFICTFQIEFDLKSINQESQNKQSNCPFNLNLKSELKGK